MFARWNFSPIVFGLGFCLLVLFPLSANQLMVVACADGPAATSPPSEVQEPDDQPDDKPDEKKEQAKLPTIKEIMKQAHKDGLLKKVATKKGKPADAKKLLELYEAMAKQKQPVGDAKSWKAKNVALVAAAKAMVNGKANAQKLLRAATNCAACHKLHKPKIVVEEKK